MNEKTSLPYFRLRSDCFLVSGKKGSVLYDVTRKKAFLLDQESSEFLRLCEGPQPLKDEWRKGRLHHFLDLMIREGLGFYYPHPVYVDNFLLESPINHFGGMAAPPPNYQVAAWHITNQCDHQCAFCPTDFSNPLWQACLSCVRRHNVTEDPALFSDPVAVIEQASHLGIWGLHIRGGNPLLEWDRLMAILRGVARFPHLKTTITTPGTGISLEQTLSLYEVGVALNLNIVLFEHDPDVFETGDGFQFKLLDALEKKNAAFDIAVVIANPPLVYKDSVSRKIFNRWGRRPRFVEFHTLPEENGTPFHFARTEDGRKRLCKWANATEFFHRANNRACLHGGFEVGLDGTLRACAGCHHSCGKIANSRLRNALKEEHLYDLWKLSKEKVVQCMDCGLRFACTDCLAADLLGATNKRVAAGYCPIMDAGDCFNNAKSFQHDGFVQRLSIEKGLEDA